MVDGVGQSLLSFASGVLSSLRRGSDTGALRHLARPVRWRRRALYGMRRRLPGAGLHPGLSVYSRRDHSTGHSRSRGEMASYLAPVPIYVILSGDAGLKGAAAATRVAGP